MDELVAINELYLLPVLNYPFQKEVDPFET